MEDILNFDISPVEDIGNSMSEMLDMVKEQLIALIETIKDKAKKALLIMMLSGAMTPVLASPVEINTAVDCTEVFMSVSADKYYNKLDRMLLLEDDWDNEGAKAVDRMAVENTRQLISLLPENVLQADLRIFASELGAVSLKLSTSKGMLRSEIGDTIFSYYIKRDGSKSTERHSFEDWSEPNISAFVSSLSNLV